MLFNNPLAQSGEGKDATEINSEYQLSAIPTNRLTNELVDQRKTIRSKYAV